MEHFFIIDNFLHIKHLNQKLIAINVNCINDAYNKEHHIVLTTARPEYLRIHTMKELDEANIQYHKLIMGIARGTRLLINDNEEKNINRAFVINVTRNSNFSDNQTNLFNSIAK